jgi:CubicO group peptidase (beta-lactamase class C family)
MNMDSGECWDRSEIRGHRFAAVLAVVLLAACDSGGGAPRVPAGVASEDSSQAGQSDRVLRQRLDPDAPGCSAAVGVDGTVVWTGGDGIADLATGRTIAADTAFDIGSVSKQFTATAILLLVDGDRLSLGDSVAKHLVGLPAWAGQVTVAQLMHHSSGLPDYEALLMERGQRGPQRTTQADALKALGGVSALRFDPGTAFEYSNSNYLLLAEVVLSVSGTPLPRFLQQRIFGPLSLDMVLDPVRRTPKKAISYVDGRDGRGWQVADWPGQQIGDSAIQTTPSELVRWADNYRTGAVGGARLLQAQLAGTKRMYPETDRGYGAGIVVLGDGRLDHDGATGGFRTGFEISADRHTAVAVACNSPAAPRTDIKADLREIWTRQP